MNTITMTNNKRIRRLHKNNNINNNKNNNNNIIYLKSSFQTSSIDYKTIQ